MRRQELLELGVREAGVVGDVDLVGGDPDVPTGCRVDGLERDRRPGARHGRRRERAVHHGVDLDRQPRKKGDVLVAFTVETEPPMLRVPSICSGFRGMAIRFWRHVSVSVPWSVDTKSCVAAIPEMTDDLDGEDTIDVGHAIGAEVPGVLRLRQLGYHGGGVGNTTKSSGVSPASGSGVGIGVGFGMGAITGGISSIRHGKNRLTE